MKFTIALALSMAFAIPAFSQNEFIPGYIITNGKDTVRGFIQRTIEDKLSSAVQFKADQNGVAQTYLPGSIVSFGFENDIYKTVIFQNTTLDPIVTDSSFARQLVLGKYQLYTFSRKERVFFIISDGTVSSLLFDASFKGQNELDQEGNYVSRLTLLMSQCQNIFWNSKTIDYTEKDISDFVSRLNNCIAPGSTQNFYHKKKSKTDIFVFGGGLPAGAESQITFEALGQYYFPSVSLQTSFNAGLHYSRTVTTDHVRNAANVSYVRTIIHQVYSIPLTIQYNFLNGNVKPYMYGGFSVAYLDEAIPNPVEYDQVQPQQKFGMAVILGVGIEVRVVNKLWIRADYRYELLAQLPAIGIAYQLK